jgi:hypothetical protein
MTPVEFLAEKWELISSMMNSHDPITLQTVPEMNQSLQEAIEKEKQMFKSFYTIGVMNGMVSNKMDAELDIDKLFDELYKKYTH